ncbi:MAG: YCF48-related protein [Nitrososphaerales archaeon]
MLSLTACPDYLGKSRTSGKRLLHTLLFLLLSTKICFAQWFWQNPLPTGQTLQDVQVFDENTTIAVGGAGTIIKTMDGGISWVSQNSGTNADFYSVYFVDLNTGWTVGSGGGTILKTTNGGANWSSQGSQNYDPLYSVFFINSSIGWIAGEDNTILKTTNGGADWVFLQGVFPKSVRSIYFTDENNGCAVGIDYTGGSYTGTILKTTDGGTSWNIQLSGLSNWLFSICFANSNTGWAVGGGIILNTVDGGVNWNAQVSGTTAWFNGVSFTDTNTGTTVGGNWNGTNYETTILRTTNGGTNWMAQTSGTMDLLNDVSFIDANNGTAVGDSGAILRTTNGGTTFVEEEELNEIPSEFVLLQNYPNPFNPSTKIKYSIPQSSNVTIKVFDILGNEIETSVNEEKPVGSYEITWYAANLPSGIYFYQLKAGVYTAVKKMILLK